jgi:glycosyltransferase involved in cell wall biosynthesis
MITVVIPTQNRGELLSKCLASLLLQSKSVDFEVIVVDNGSTDTTQNVIAEYRSKIARLISLYAPVPGLHTGRHAGMLAATGDILVFADDDIEATPSWIASIHEAFIDPNVVMVGGNNYPMFLSPPPNWLAQLWNMPSIRGYKSIPSLSVIEFIRPPKELSPFFVWGCNFAIRKNVLLAAGGFHPDGMPRDLIRFRGDGETHVSRYVAQKGLKCVFHPGASVHHKVTPDRMTHDYFRRRGFSQGVSDSYTRLRQGNLSASLNKPNTLGHIFRRLAHSCRNSVLGADVRRALDQLSLGHREGFTYHQAVYKDDAVVREWVHRTSYYEGNPGND